MSNWSLKSNEVTESGRIVVLEYEYLRRTKLFPIEGDITALIAAEGEQLVKLVEEQKKKQAEATANQVGCPKCKERKLVSIAPKPKKTLGVISIIKGVLSGAAPEGIQEARLRTCKSCQELNSKGERLFRELDGKMYCGTPRLTDIYRDESQEGCGCDLAFKTSLSDTCCPLGKWIKFSTSKSGGCGCNKSSPSPSTSQLLTQDIS